VARLITSGFNVKEAGSIIRIWLHFTEWGKKPKMDHKHEKVYGIPFATWSIYVLWNDQIYNKNVYMFKLWYITLLIAIFCKIKSFMTFALRSLNLYQITHIKVNCFTFCVSKMMNAQRTFLRFLRRDYFTWRMLAINRPNHSDTNILRSSRATLLMIHIPW
jgi:hypothetical protein